MYCENCGAYMVDSAVQCSACGYSKVKFKFCTKCGTKMRENLLSCPNCGYPAASVPPASNLPPIAPQPSRTVMSMQTGQPIFLNSVQPPAVRTVQGKVLSRRNKWVAFLLCLFLGVIGAHKFYDKSIGWGVVYMFTLGLFGIGVIVDLVNYLMADEYYYV